MEQQQQQREAVESQCKDIELMAEWMNPSKGKRVALELSAILPTTFDLLYGVWDPTRSAERNLRMLMICMMKYTATCEEPSSQRFVEVRTMRPVLFEVYELWQQQHKGDDSRISACPMEK